MSSTTTANPKPPARPNPGAIECPTCKAREGEVCRDRHGNRTEDHHHSRKLAAKSKASKDATRAKAKASKSKPSASKSKPPAPAQAELGVNGLSLDELSAPKLREALERRCTECGAFPGAPCTTIPRDEPGEREELRDRTGARLVHAARRTIELDLSVEGLSITVKSGGHSVTLEQPPKLKGEAREVRCPLCSAREGEPCTQVGGARQKIAHHLRTAIARRNAGVELTPRQRDALNRSGNYVARPEPKPEPPPAPGTDALCGSCGWTGDAGDDSDGGEASGPPKTWADIGLPAGVVVPSLGELPHPWVRCQPRPAADTHMVPILYGQGGPPRYVTPAYEGEPGWIIGYAYEAVPGATLSVAGLYEGRLSATHGIPAERLQLGTAVWLTTREAIADELERYAYDPAGIAKLLADSGWKKGSKSKRAKSKAGPARNKTDGHVKITPAFLRIASCAAPCPVCRVAAGAPCVSTDLRGVARGGSHTERIDRLLANPCPTCGVESGKFCIDTDHPEAPLYQTTRGREVEHIARMAGAPMPAEPETKAAEPAPDACYECEHADCPISPDCSGCPTCAAERAAAGTDAKITRAEALLEEGPAPEQLTQPQKAAAEGPGSSAAAATTRARRTRPSAGVMTHEVYIASIRRDGGTQPRATIDPAVVEEYAQAISDGATLPPPVVFCEDLFTGPGDGPFWAADGFHRIAAYERLGIASIVCELHQGGRRDAILYSVGANATHGLKRSNADKRRSVLTLLHDEEWSRKADRWIATACAVHPSTVGDIRRELRAQASDSDTSSEPELREGRDGKLYPVRAPEPSLSPADATPPPIVEPDEDAEPCSMCFGYGAEDEGCLACGQVATPDASSLEARPVAEATEPSDGAERRVPSKAKTSWRDVLKLRHGSTPAEALVAYQRLDSAACDTLRGEECRRRREELRLALAVGLSQWDTRPALADQMVELAGVAGMDRPCVLEPSAGRGSIVDAVRRANRLAHITAHEIDPDRVTFLQAIKSANVVHAGDFLAWDVPSRPYDVAIGNTPYEGGADGFFLERMMACSNVVVPLLRINAMTGKARHDRIWSRVRAGEWHLSDLRYLEKRPEFDGPGEDSAMSDYVVVKLVRAEPGGRPRPTMVDWW